MKQYNTPMITEGVFSVGVKDFDRKLFDALIPLPQGTTYNSYIVKGKEKNALIDTVNPGFERELVDRISEVSDVKNLDYLIMNHAEPDHAGSIPYILEMNKKIILVTSEKGAKMASVFYNVPEKRIKKVRDGDTIDLGGKTLQFIDAPWLHWPETMFTYLIENKVLFSCDFFGAHTAQGTYDEDVEELITFAQRYFGEIMMPFNNMGKKTMEKIKDLKIEFIAPSHGPIYHNPKEILDVYNKWTKGETKNKVIIVYVSMWKSTEKMIKTIVEILREEGLEVSIHNLVHADLGDIAKDLVDSRGIVLGAPTVLGGMHPIAVYASYLVKALRPPLKYAVVLSSFGWGGGTLKQASELLSPTKINIIGTLEINGPPTNDNLQEIINMGKQLATKIKEG